MDVKDHKWMYSCDTGSQKTRLLLVATDGNHALEGWYEIQVDNEKTER
jgi:hypothetical protein